MRNTNTNRTLSAAAILAALVLAGCNRALPTEPQSSVTEVPAFAPSASSSEAASTRTRTRGARGSDRPSTVSTPSAPSTEPATNPTTPPAPTVTNDCKGPCDGILRVPAYDAYMAAIYAARDRVRSAVASGEIKTNNKVRDWNVTPNVEWRACFFWVENGFWYDAQGNKHVGGCAAGMTDWANKKIVISTKDDARTLALVKWEATNYYLYLIGRKDLLDRFQ